EVPQFVGTPHATLRGPWGRPTNTWPPSGHRPAKPTAANPARGDAPRNTPRAVGTPHEHAAPERAPAGQAHRGQPRAWGRPTQRSARRGGAPRTRGAGRGEGLTDDEGPAECSGSLS